MKENTYLKYRLVNAHYYVVAALIVCQIFGIAAYGVIMVRLFKDTAELKLLNHIIFDLALAQLVTIGITILYRNVFKDDIVLISDNAFKLITYAERAVFAVGLVFAVTGIIVKESNGIPNGSDFYFSLFRPLIVVLISRINTAVAKWLYKKLMHVETDNKTAP